MNLARRMHYFRPPIAYSSLICSWYEPLHFHVYWMNMCVTPRVTVFPFCFVWPLRYIYFVNGMFQWNSEWKIIRVSFDLLHLLHRTQYLWSTVCVCSCFDTSTVFALCYRSSSKCRACVWRLSLYCNSERQCIAHTHKHFLTLLLICLPYGSYEG